VTLFRQTPRRSPEDLFQAISPAQLRLFTGCTALGTRTDQQTALLASNLSVWECLSRLTVPLAQLNNWGCPIDDAEAVLAGLNLKGKAVATCDNCARGKARRLPFALSDCVANATRPLDLVGADLWGKSPITSMGGPLYVSLIFDVTTNHSSFLPITQKSAAYSHYDTWVKEFNHFAKHPLILQTDDGGEYRSNKFTERLRNDGTTHQVNQPYTSPHNTITERRFLMIFNYVRTCLIHAGLGLSL